VTIDWTQVYEAARRSNLAYIIDPTQSKQEFEATGLHWLGIYQGASHQAVACMDNLGQAYLSISGTRFGKRLGDLVDDALAYPHDLGGGVHVTAGAFDDCPGMWDWANKLVDSNTVWNVEGHSLGAWRMRYTPVFLDQSRIGRLHSFESPKGANRAYWEKYQKQLADMVTIVNDRDIFIDWPFGILNEWEQPAMLPMIWLRACIPTTIYPIQWPSLSFSIKDHSIDTIEAKCKTLAGL
jgi:hypothetical protein